MLLLEEDAFFVPAPAAGSALCLHRPVAAVATDRLAVKVSRVSHRKPWRWHAKKKKKQSGRGTSVKIQMVFLSRDISTFITEYRALTCRILNYNSVTFIPHSITNRYTKRMRNNFRMCCLELNNNHPPHNAKPAIGLKNLTFLLRNGVISVTKVSVLQIINHKAFFFFLWKSQ